MEELVLNPKWKLIFGLIGGLIVSSAQARDEGAHCPVPSGNPGFPSALQLVQDFKSFCEGVFRWNQESAEFEKTPSSREKEKKPVTFKILLVIKSKTSLELPGQPKIQTEMKQSDIDAITRAFKEHASSMVQEMSGYRVAWQVTVMVSPDPVKKVSALGDPKAPNYWLSPGDAQVDLQEYVKPGDYDGIFFYWTPTELKTGKTISSCCSWSLGPYEKSKSAGYTSLNYAPEGYWGPDSSSVEMIVHEWLHQVGIFYGKYGVASDDTPEGVNVLDNADKFGYSPDSSGSYKRFLKDFLDGKVKAGKDGYLGLGERAWNLGSIIERSACGLNPTAGGGPIRKSD